MGPEEYVDHYNLEDMTTLYNYSEPFSCECRAFGRLKETGHEELAVKCFGYLLLDEEHERAMMKQFHGINSNFLDFNGSLDSARPDLLELRWRFLGKDGRPAPIRGIVKEFGKADEPLHTRFARKILRDITRLQQLGMIDIDVAHRQFINGKISDFSTAITIPHFLTNPELNPLLTPEWVSAMEFETFQFSVNDYGNFDDMVRQWNWELDEQDEQANAKKKLAVYAFPNRNGANIKYNLRSTASRERVFSLVDPRLYDWRKYDGSSVQCTMGVRRCEAKGRKLRSMTKSRNSGNFKKLGSNVRPRLDSKPPRWYYDCDKNAAVRLILGGMQSSLKWEVKDGLIFPRHRWRDS